MLLTDALIEDIHAMRLTMMRDLVSTYRQRFPEAKGQEFGGGYASFAGKGVPLSQVYGVGHRGAAFDLDEIDAFYADLGDNWEFIVTPFCSDSVLKSATKHGYELDHFESVMGQIVGDTQVEPIAGVTVEEVESDFDLWHRTSDAGWAGTDDLPTEPSLLSTAMSQSRTTRRYLARVDGEPAATASLGDYGGKFLFAGASTRIQFRGRGLQRLLTQRRIRDAGKGAYVQVITMPGSESHRNAQRVGFRPLYSKLVLYRYPTA